MPARVKKRIIQSIDVVKQTVDTYHVTPLESMFKCWQFKFLESLFVSKMFDRWDHASLVAALCSYIQLNSVLIELVTSVVRSWPADWPDWFLQPQLSYPTGTTMTTYPYC